MLGIHFRTPYRVGHDRGCMCGPMTPPGGCHKPVVMISGHQDQFASPMPGDLHRLAPRLMLKFAELALKLHRGCPSHGSLDA